MTFEDFIHVLKTIEGLCLAPSGTYTDILKVVREALAKVK
jgi:hypothetical protein